MPLQSAHLSFIFGFRNFSFRLHIWVELAPCGLRVVRIDPHRFLAGCRTRRLNQVKPNRGEGIVSRKPRSKSTHDFLGLLYCFIVLLCICVVSCPYLIYYPTVMARYSLFVLKVPLNPKQTNKHLG